MAAAAEATDPPSSSMACVLSMPILNHSSTHKATTVQGINATIVVMQETLEQRLKQAMALANTTVAELSRKSGVTYQGIKKAYDGKTNEMTIKVAEQLAKVLQCNKYWLMTGEGEPQFSAQQSGHPPISPSGRFVIQNVTDGPEPNGPYPLISEVQAGVWTELCDNFQPGEADDWFTSSKNLGKCGYLLRVKGQSMFAPGQRHSFSEGMILHVNPDLEPTPGQFVVVRRESSREATFKRYVLIEGTPYLEAINPDWPRDERYLKLQKGDVWCGVVVDASIGGLP